MSRSSVRFFILLSLGLAWFLGRDLGHAAELKPRIYTLEEIIKIVLEHNPAITGAEGGVEQSLGRKQAAGAYLNPTFNGTAGRGSIRDPSTGVSITERTFTVEQPLEWLGKRTARKQVAEAGVAGAQAAVEETRLDVIAETKTAFYSMLLAQRRTELATDNVTMMDKLIELVKVRVASGDATRFELMKTEVEGLKVRQELTRARSRIIIARAELGALTAGTLGADFLVEGEFLAFEEPPSVQTIIGRAREQHPTIRRLQRQVEQAGYQVVHEEESRIPNVTISGQYHREAGDESVTAGLSVPVPVWYRQQGEITAALGAKRRAEAELIRIQAGLAKALTQEMQEVRVAKEQIGVFEEGFLKQAQRTVQIARASFEQGYTALLDLLDAQRVYRQTQYDYAQARFDLATALVRLERSAGGSL